ncbi:hypothetical protein SASPL_151677 [Salvia splendens]|uniref:Ferric-chelate reductase n=1 Tax=Salvia splendens TaxID=180675 RepID=A0A8X8W871_SALSN|nr:hypothetical protein SASPL_151677 [Salvia splendens]
MLIVIIFMGYLMIWIMMPTNEFWLHWLPHIHAKTDSTYLGQKGANILIYTFPILLIAILGCLYLHLDKYGDDTDNRRREDQYFASWKQPLLVRGPLGVISCTELLFMLMFVVLLVWSFSAYLHGMFNNITRESASKMGDVVWEVRLDSVALLLGLVGNICLSFLFFPVARGSPIVHLVGLTSESSIKYHIWLGHTVLTLFLSHGLCYVVFWANTDQISEMLKWNRTGISNVAGEVALLCGTVMWIASISHVRRKLFELHEMLVLVSGGSGITPFISIIRELIFLSNAHEKTPRVLLVAVFKKSADVSMLNLLLPLSGTPCDVACLQLHIQAYVTRDTSPSTDSQKLPINIWSEPSVSGATPVTGVLGSSSWLWLGAIISASFVVFLIIIRLVNLVSMDVVYSQAVRSLISTLFLCVAVATVVTIAFLWNKKHNTKECRQIDSATIPFPTERELESIPEESLKKITTVHYGPRPDFKKILSKCEGRGIGVFVSSSQKMKQDVAAICSSDSTKRLHYQSFSFNW